MYNKKYTKILCRKYVEEIKRRRDKKQSKDFIPDR